MVLNRGQVILNGKSSCVVTETSIIPKIVVKLLHFSSYNIKELENVHFKFHVNKVLNHVFLLATLPEEKNSKVKQYKK